MFLKDLLMNCAVMVMYSEGPEDELDMDSV